MGSEAAVCFSAYCRRYCGRELADCLLAAVSVLTASDGIFAGNIDIASNIDMLLCYLLRRPRPHTAD